MKNVSIVIFIALFINLNTIFSQVAATDAGSTPGGVSVTASGGAVYSIPVEVPPGIKDVVPNISLAYNSQARNGLAGWGWNLTGLSTISRIPSTMYHDGQIDPVDFDNLDRFALNGQRLIAKVGEYGKPGTEYITESYSNLRIFGYGTSIYGSNYGPRYFVVIYPDGSRAWYGSNTNSSGKMEWAIDTWMDPQNNEILYYYSKSNGLLRISKVSYGARTGSNPPISIEFIYKSRNRSESTYIGNSLFKRANILDKIQVKYLGTKLKEYSLNHNINSLGYETVGYVQERDGSGRALAPITFDYGNTLDGITRTMKSNISTQISQFSFINDESKSIPGDFNGDGKTDVLTYNKSSKNYLNLIMDIHKGANNMDARHITTSNFKDIIVGPILTNNKLGQKTGIVSISESFTGTTAYSNVAFKMHLVDDSGLNRVLTRNWSSPTYRSETTCDNSNRSITSKRYISGDFNGDGVLDALALTYPYTETFCNPSNDCNGPDPIAKGSSATDCCNCTNYSRNNSKSFFIDLNSSNTINYTNYSGELNSPIKYNEPIYAVDFNGDGKSDLVHVLEGRIEVYELNQNNSLSHLTSITDTDINLEKPILTGDFNGDGLYDLSLPIDSYDGSDQWKFYYSTGNSTTSFTANTGVNYYRNIVQGDIALNTHRYTAQDFNADGKTDILHHFVKKDLDPSTLDGYQHLELYANTSSNPAPLFTSKATATFTEYLRNNGIPVVVPSISGKGTLEYAYLEGSQIHLYDFSKNNGKDTTLESVVNRGLTTNLMYDSLTNNSNTYEAVYSESYPYVNVNLAPGYQVVERIEEKGSGMTRYQDYRYSGAVAHAKGLGLIGFKRIHRSNWFGNNVTRLWNSSAHDPLKRGAVTKHWVSNTLGYNPIGQVSQTDFTYITNTLANKVFINVPQTVVSKDLLQGITNTKSLVYDSFYNPLMVTTSNISGNKVETYTYSNNPTVNNNYYHIGRIKTKKVVSTLDGHSFTSEEGYSYVNNLLSQFKKRGVGTDWLVESYAYDSWGNVVSKNISALGMPSKSESFEYLNGRLLKSQTDTEGLVTSWTYFDNWALPKKITDPYGRSTTYTYDTWNRIKSSTDFNNKITTYSYLNRSNGTLEKKVDYNQGMDQISVLNAFGWETLSKTLTFNGNYIQTVIQYDASGRNTKTSEPHFAGQTPKWNSTYFDEYNRVILKRSFTGKETNISYNGLVTTVSNGVKTASTTRDMSGNIIELVDEGGTIKYKYFGNATLREIDHGGQKTTIQIDSWGKRTAMTDPSAGTYTYQYNIYGELLKEISPKGTTTYEYDSLGKLLKKSIVGDQTDLELNYIYNSDRLVAQINGSDNFFNKTYSYNYTYDNLKRLKKTTETNDLAVFEVELDYDGHGRVEFEEYVSTNTTDGSSSTVKVKNEYNTSSGILEEIRNASDSKLLWELNSHDQWLQSTNITLGNGLIESNEFDAVGLPKNLQVHTSGSSPTYALNMEYRFNASRGILDYRKNHNLSWTENFVHDSQDRLTQINGPAPRNQDYDGLGRITNNSLLGSYAYNSAKKYQLASLGLNESGTAHYQGHENQQITYNAFKKPVDINEPSKGRVNFEYGPMGNRAHAWYGGQQENKADRRYHKHYSAISPVEIVEDKQEGNVKIITYIGGNAYNAAIAHIKTKNNDVSGYHYLHRDYLGSILAISDSSGSIKEQRQFGAWGSVDKFVGSNGNTIFGNDSILNRGYTGHEHFFDVDLIHMNGRMYDFTLGRFLSPDNYVQDPYNTQSFNRYGYVFNNPLVFTDPSGEIVPLLIYGAAAAVGAYFGAAQANGSYNPLNWDWSWGSSTYTGLIGGAIIGGISGGVGTLVAAPVGIATTALGGLFSSTLSGIAGGAVGGFISGGFMSMLPGGDGDFFGGAKKGAIWGAAIGGVLGAASHLLKGSLKPTKPGTGQGQAPQTKVPTDTKPLAPIDNELVIDADLLPAPKPTTPAQPTGNSTTKSLQTISDGLEGNLKLNPTRGNEIKVQTPTRGVNGVIKKGSIFTSGNQHGVKLHWDNMTKLATELAESGNNVYLNKAINTALGKKIPNVGSLKPDVIGVGNNNTITLIEVVSPSQTTAQITAKVNYMASALSKNGYIVNTRVISPGY